MPNLTSEFGFGHFHVFEEHLKRLVFVWLPDAVVHLHWLNLSDSGLGRCHALDFK